MNDNLLSAQEIYSMIKILIPSLKKHMKEFRKNLPEFKTKAKPETIKYKNEWEVHFKEHMINYKNECRAKLSELLKKKLGKLFNPSLLEKIQSSKAYKTQINTERTIESARERLKVPKMKKEINARKRASENKRLKDPKTREEVNKRRRENYWEQIKDPKKREEKNKRRKKNHEEQIKDPKRKEEINKRRREIYREKVMNRKILDKMQKKDSLEASKVAFSEVYKNSDTIRINNPMVNNRNLLEALEIEKILYDKKISFDNSKELNPIYDNDNLDNLKKGFNTIDLQSYNPIEVEGPLVSSEQIDDSLEALDDLELYDLELNDLYLYDYDPGLNDFKNESQEPLELVKENYFNDDRDLNNLEEMLNSMISYGGDNKDNTICNEEKSPLEDLSIGLQSHNPIQVEQVEGPLGSSEQIDDSLEGLDNLELDDLYFYNCNLELDDFKNETQEPLELIKENYFDSSTSRNMLTLKQLEERIKKQTFFSKSRNSNEIELLKKRILKI